MESFAGEEVWLAFLERRWVTCCSYLIETCSGCTFLKNGVFVTFPLGKDDLFAMSRIILALISKYYVASSHEVTKSCGRGSNFFLIALAYFK